VLFGKVISQTPKNISSTKYYQTIAPQVSFRCFLKRLIEPTIFYWTCFHDPFYLFSKSTDMRVLDSVFLPVNPVGKIAEKGDCRSAFLLIRHSKYSARFCPLESANWIEPCTGKFIKTLLNVFDRGEKFATK